MVCVGKCKCIPILYIFRKGEFMKIKEVECFLTRNLNESPQNISIGFAQKNKGIIIAPYIDHILKEQIFRTLTDFVKSEIVNKNPIPYCADGIREGELEFISKEMFFSGSGKGDENCFGVRLSDNRRFDWNHLDYYVVRIESNKMVMKFYKKTPKVYKAQKKLLLQVTRNELERIESDFISIDNTVDFLEWKDEFLVFNHGALKGLVGKGK